MQITEKVIATSVSANIGTKKSEFSEKEFFKHLQQQDLEKSSGVIEETLMSEDTPPAQEVAAKMPTSPFWAGLNKDRIAQLNGVKELNLVIS